MNILPDITTKLEFLPVVQQSVAGDFQFGPGAEACTALLRDVDRLDDSLAVALPVHDPLVEAACCYGEEATHVGGGGGNILSRISCNPVS
jgi:hypothetical protein